METKVIVIDLFVPMLLIARFQFRESSHVTMEENRRKGAQRLNVPQAALSTIFLRGEI